MSFFVEQATLPRESGLHISELLQLFLIMGPASTDCFS